MKLFSGKKEKSTKEHIEKIILERYNQYYRLAYSYVHNSEDAYDIVQNGACKALKKAGTLKNAEYAATWIYRIMLNECFEQLRRKAPSFSEEELSEVGYTEDKSEYIDLKTALEKLPDKDKAVILLKYFEGRTLEETADILNENISTVKSRLYRSIRKLRAELSDGTGGN